MELDQLKKAMPALPPQRLLTHGPALLRAMEEAYINTPLRQAHFLAQVGHESGDLRWLLELASGNDYEGRKDLGNTEPGDGRRFKGRGFIQLTGRANYRAFALVCGRDLITHPELVSDDPDICAASATWFWSTRGLNSLADVNDLEGITRKINGGVRGLEDRRRRLVTAKAALGIGEPRL